MNLSSISPELYPLINLLVNGILPLFMIMILIPSLIALVSQWIIYKKAGKKGWEAIVPIYNIIVLLEIIELPMWYILLFFIPFANVYAIFKIYIELAHKFGKSTGFGVATAFFYFICLPILAFGKNNVYNGNNMGNEMQIGIEQYVPNDNFNFQKQQDTMTNNMNSFDNQNTNMFNQLETFVNNDLQNQPINTEINNSFNLQSNFENSNNIENSFIQQPTMINQNMETQTNNMTPTQIFGANSNNQINNIQEPPFIQNQSINNQINPQTNFVPQNNNQIQSVETQIPQNNFIYGNQNVVEQIMQPQMSNTIINHQPQEPFIQNQDINNQMQSFETSNQQSNFVYGSQNNVGTTQQPQMVNTTTNQQSMMPNQAVNSPINFVNQNNNPYNQNM